MSWVYVDDQASDHPKQEAAGAEACWLWACGLMWCNRAKTSRGNIPFARVRALYVPFTEAQSKRLAAVLVKVGLWHETDDGYLIHDYDQYQRLKDKRSESAKLASNKRWHNGSAPDASVMRGASVPHCVTQSESQSDGNARARAGGMGMGVSTTETTVQEATAEPESGHDLARRVWLACWLASAGSNYVLSPTLGPGGDDAAFQRLGNLAREHAPNDASGWLAARVAAYLADRDPWLVERRHPLGLLPKRLNQYGPTVKPRSTAPEVYVNPYKPKAPK
jgi:hypothetical protein